jgi:hypothetical protein
MVVRAGPRPEILAPLTGDRRALREALESAGPRPAPADLREAVRLARSVLGESGSVAVLTDGAAPVPELPGVRVVQVGDALANSGIVALGVRPADLSREDHELFVRVRNASDEPVRGTVRLLVDGKVRDAAALRAGPGAEAGATLRLAGVREGYLEAVWETEGGDALPLDDRAAWVLAPPEGRRYRLVGDVDPYLRRALALDPDWSEARGGERADLEIVAGQAPAPAGPPFLWIDPPGPREGTAPGAVVLDWERTHPALRFVELQPVRMGHVPRLRRPAGARVLAESSAGPMILEGQEGERAYLLWAFDPMETDLPLRASFPLLVRNSLEHLAPEQSGVAGGIATGRHLEVPWPSGEPARLISPSGEEVALAHAGGSLRTPPIEEIGVWRLVGEGRELRFAGSLLDGEETDLRPRTVGGRGADSRSRTVSEAALPALHALTPPLILAAILLLLLEGAAYHRRWTP